jgi:hypothetical protein
MRCAIVLLIVLTHFLARAEGTQTAIVTWDDLVPYMKAYLYITPADDPEGSFYFHICSGVNLVSKIEKVHESYRAAVFEALSGKIKEDRTFLEYLFRLVNSEHERLKASGEADIRKLQEASWSAILSDRRFKTGMGTALTSPLSRRGLVLECPDCREPCPRPGP